MAETAIAAQAGEEFHDDIIYPATIPFLLIHLSAFLAIWTGVSLWAVGLCLGLYVVRMIIVTAGYHRYFSHRSFKTSRVGQFVLAFLAQTSLQRGVIWWAAIHRHHHKHSDTELDVHSPRHRSFLYSHVGWIFSSRDDTPDYSTVQDLMAYPELRWLERNHHVPWIMVAALVFALGGAQALVVGWIWSTLILYHGSFSINSLAHVRGNQRYVTGDDSRNNWWLAILTMGEGWHNNHHAYQSSTRQGFRWYEWDLTYYTLKVLSWFRIVWDLRSPPEEIVNNERKLGRRVVEQVAHQMAETFPIERMAAQVRAAWDQVPDLADVRRDLGARYDNARLRAGEAREYLAARLDAVHLPHVPTMEEMRQRVQKTFAQVPDVSIDDVAARSRQLLLEALSIRLLDGPEPLYA
jgi:stearoyl-CoA desaturase (Delta-9 desaturase)